MTSPHDDLENLLRDELRRETDQVTTEQGALQMIQQRTRSTSTSFVRRPWVAAGLGAALATAATITAITLVGNDDDNRTPQSADNTTQATQTTETTAPSVTPMHNATYEPDSQENQVLYYLGQPGPGDTGVRLYGEPHTTPGFESKDYVAAVRELLTSVPLDPDYTSGWPEGVDIEDNGITSDGGATTIKLFGTADLADSNGLTQQEASMAIQAIGRTAGASDGMLAFTYNGDPVTTLLGINVGKSVQVMPEADVRAMNHIESIVEGQTVTSPVTVSGSGTAFEGTLNWILYDEAGTEIRSHFTQTGSMGDFQGFTIQLGNLDPGTYTIKTLEYSMEDGAPNFPDTKTFVVE